MPCCAQAHDGFTMAECGLEWLVYSIVSCLMCLPHHAGGRPGDGQLVNVAWPGDRRGKRTTSGLITPSQ